MVNEVKTVNNNAEGEKTSNFSSTAFNTYNVYIKEIRDIPVLSREETSELYTKYKKYNDTNAYNKLIQSNLKLVLKIVGKYGCNNNDRMDLIQEGNLGLMQAIERHDPSRGTALTTTIACWVNKYIKEYIQKNSIIREPEGVYRLKRRVEKAMQDYYQIYGNENPTEIELHTFDKNLSLEDIRKVMESNSKKNIISLDMHLDDEAKESESLCSYIAAQITVQDELQNRVENNERREVIQKIISSGVLTEREKEILTYRFGIYDGDYKSRNRASDDLRLSRQRVDCIEKQSIEKLKSRYGKKLSSLL